MLGSCISWTRFRGWGAVEIAYTFLGGCYWEAQMWKNGVSIKRRNSFPFKEEHQELLKLRVPLGKCRYIQKTEFSLKRKNHV